MDPALAGLPPSDWEAPPPPARPAARLYLPGNECLAQAVDHRWRRARHRAACGPAAPARPARPASPPAAAAADRRRRPDAAARRRPSPRRRRRRSRPGTPITAPRVTRLVPVESGTTVPARRPRPAGTAPVDAAVQLPSSGADRRPAGAPAHRHDADQLTHRRRQLPERAAAIAADQRRQAQPSTGGPRRRRARRGAGAVDRRAGARRRRAHRPADPAGGASCGRWSRRARRRP